MWKKIVLLLFILLLLTLDGFLIAGIFTNINVLFINISAIVITIPLIIYYILFLKD